MAPTLAALEKKMSAHAATIKNQAATIKKQDATIQHLKHLIKMDAAAIQNGEHNYYTFRKYAADTLIKHELTLKKLCDAVNSNITKKSMQVKIVTKVPKEVAESESDYDY